MLIVEIVVGIGVLVGGYFGYTYLFSDESTSEKKVIPAQLGPNMASFSNFIAKEKINFDTIAVLDTPFVKSLVDYSQTFATTSVRGRLNPFVPYDLTRPLR